MKSPLRFALALAAAVVFAPVHAQSAPNLGPIPEAMNAPSIGTLTVNTGTVMTSMGGEFVSASSGQSLQAGERLMVSEGGNATVNFLSGPVVEYTAPGVYTINVPYVGVPVPGAGASIAATTGALLGATALGAAAVEQAGENVPPESPVSR